MLCLVDLLLVLGFVSATYTNTVFVAGPSSRETLAIQLEAINLSALAALPLKFLFGFHGSWRVVLKTVLGRCGGPSVVQEAFKEVASTMIFIEHGLNVVGVE